MLTSTNHGRISAFLKVRELPTEPHYCKCEKPTFSDLGNDSLSSFSFPPIKKKLYFCTNCEKRVIKAKGDAVSTICDKCSDKPHKKIEPISNDEFIALINRTDKVDIICKLWYKQCEIMEHLNKREIK